LEVFATAALETVGVSSMGRLVAIGVGDSVKVSSKRGSAVAESSSTGLDGDETDVLRL
jgi:hypothetical protein